MLRGGRERILVSQGHPRRGEHPGGPGGGIEHLGLVSLVLPVRPGGPGWLGHELPIQGTAPDRLFGSRSA